MVHFPLVESDPDRLNHTVHCQLSQEIVELPYYVTYGICRVLPNRRVLSSQGLSYFTVIAHITILH